MGKQSFKNFGIRSITCTTSTAAAGRYAVQEKSERLIIPDILKKLNISLEDNLLDIGCGVGTIFIPLSFFVNTATGLDHPDVIERLKKSYVGRNMKLHGLNFFDFKNYEKKKFTKILTYSVIQYLSGIEEVKLFCKKAISLLKPGGLMLIGDVPNVDLKNRFLSSKNGQKFLDKWKKNSFSNDNDKFASELSEDKKVFIPCDKNINELISFLNKLGVSVYILPQPKNLPFGHTRHDLLLEVF